MSTSATGFCQHAHMASARGRRARERARGGRKDTRIEREPRERYPTGLVVGVRLTLFACCLEASRLLPLLESRVCTGQIVEMAPTMPESDVRVRADGQEALSLGEVVGVLC